MRRRLYALLRLAVVVSVLAAAALFLAYTPQGRHLVRDHLPTTAAP